MILTQGLIRHLENGDVKMEDRYKSLYEDSIKEYLKYRDPDKASADGHRADAEAYAKDRVKKAKENEKNRKLGVVGLSTTRNPKFKSQQMKYYKSKGGAVKKPAMAYGGMANNKKHMYAAGGSVTDNPGLKALARKRPDVVKKMGYNV